MVQRTNAFQDIRLKRQDQEKSWQWYRTNVQRLGASAQQLRNDVRTQSTFANKIQIGKMYLFRYDPKLKDVLPVYDTYPLVLPFGSAKGGFLGINLHYLPYGYRFMIIDKLKSFMTGTQENRRAQLSWEILNSVASVEKLSISVKHYLTSHVVSRFMEISHDDWKTAAALPIENFIRN